MKTMFLSQSHSLFLMVSFFSLPLLSSAISQTELDQLINNKEESYIYCDKNHSKMAEIVAEISKFDEDETSPTWQLHKHIQQGFSIGRQDAVVAALEYAEKSLEKSYPYLTDEKIEQIQTILSSVIDDVVSGKLTVNIQSLAIPKRSIAFEQNQELLRNNNLVKVFTPVKFLKYVNFKKHVKFEDHAKFEHYVKFDGNVKFGNTVTFEDNVTLEENVIIEGSLSVADETIGCDLTVGCNINMNDSSSPTVGNILKNGIPFLHNFGIQNTCVGDEAGNFTMTGQSNTAYGAFALNSNQNGYYNVASGIAALNSNEDGSVNTAIGGIALVNNISGDANTAIGFLTLVENISGNGNTAIGVGSLYHNLSADDNTAIGAGALDSSTGSNNIALGSGAGTLLTSGDDNIYIGHPGTAVETGFIRIGTYLTNIETYIQGIFNNATGVGGLGVEVDATGKLGTIVSAQRFKRNIVDMDVDSANIYKLRPVTFSYNNDAADTKQYGLIAEEVADVFPSLIAHDQDGNPYSVRYQVLPVLLLNEVQKQQVSIEQQQANIENLIERVARLEESAPAA